ncbi:uncharacterized protein LOC106083170 isoform X1 [Stomoxys calcitrans]|uniref:uncharacterized protein LOC106083170 isoform X1 n=1 Tax=Stomoxys calcitrans TaxID=35570 RepID=UPI0027E2FA9E|nr:uncharacterized protein LOC106083170 isoform X1 [Stomoxys calcitrans]
MLSCENIFIFNWVNNYKQQVEHLRETFEHESLKNRVRVFNNLTCDELYEEMDRLTKVSFDLFPYVMVVVLENKSPRGRFICTKDSYHILLDMELLTLFKTNKTLAGKPRVFIVQKLQDYRCYGDTESEDENGNLPPTVEERRKHIDLKKEFKEITKNKRLYEGLQYLIAANEETPNFQSSPFIRIFCKQFLEKSTSKSMGEIYSLIVKEIKENYGRYSIDIQLQTNKTSEDSGILDKVIDSDEMRDFL